MNRVYKNNIDFVPEGLQISCLYSSCELQLNQLYVYEWRKHKDKLFLISLVKAW